MTTNQLQIINKAILHQPILNTQQTISQKQTQQLNLVWLQVMDRGVSNPMLGGLEYNKFILYIKYQDMQQIPKGDNKQAGRWTKEEHQRFMYAIMQYGKDWKKVEQYVKTRSGSQVRSHAQKFFSKLQSISNPPIHQPSSGHILQPTRRAQQFSQTQFDIQRELNNQVTPSTPMQLVSLIRKQSKQGGKINLSNLKNTLQQHQQHRDKLASNSRDKKSNSFKGMSNILSAYEEIYNNQDIHQSQSFFISITKTYKRLFKQVQDFDKLIDLSSSHPNLQEYSQKRKRSFTIPQGSAMEEEELNEKIEEIKKKIHTAEGREGHGQGEKKERKDSESSIQNMIPPINRLSTIQQQPRQEEQVSYKAIISQEVLQGLKNCKE